MQITTNVYQVGGSDESYGQDAAIYLVRDGDRAALVDAGTGYGHTAVLDNVRNAGIEPSNIELLFLTHCHYDHTGGASLMRQATGCKIVAHTLDAVYLEAGDAEVTAASWYGSFFRALSVDVTVSEAKREFSVGSLALTMHHIPGHSPGSTALTVVSDGKLVLFGQDVHGPLNDTLLSNRDQYEKSLEFLISLDADILCEGHFGVYEGKERVRRFIESYL